jgi:hypothetical protein
MVKNELKVITKDWFKRNIISFDKNFLSKKYTNIKDNNKIKEQLVKIFGSEFMEQIDQAGTENDLFSKKVKKENAVVKVVEVDELPSANDANESVLYAIEDNKAIDEECKYHLYAAVDDEIEDTKVWIEVSSPSYIFETDNIDFEAKFRDFEIIRRKYSYLNWEGLKAKLLTFESSYNYLLNKKIKSGEFIYNNSEKHFPTVEIGYSEEDDKLYINSKEYQDDKDVFAQLILDEESELRDENETKYYYITVGEGSSYRTVIYGTYNKDAFTNSEYIGGPDIDSVEEYEPEYNMLPYFKAEMLDGKELEDESVYKYIGPKYTFLQPFSEYLSFEQNTGIFSFDGKELKIIYRATGDNGSSIFEETWNEYCRLIKEVKTDLTGRTYIGYERKIPVDINELNRYYNRNKPFIYIRDSNIDESINYYGGDNYHGDELTRKWYKEVKDTLDINN